MLYLFHPGPFRIDPRVLRDQRRANYTHDLAVVNDFRPGNVQTHGGRGVQPDVSGRDLTSGGAAQATGERSEHPYRDLTIDPCSPWLLRSVLLDHHYADGPSARSCPFRHLPIPDLPPSPPPP